MLASLSASPGVRADAPQHGARMLQPRGRICSGTTRTNRAARPCLTLSLALPSHSCWPTNQQASSILPFEHFGWRSAERDISRRPLGLFRCSTCPDCCNCAEPCELSQQASPMNMTNQLSPSRRAADVADQSASLSDWTCPRPRRRAALHAQTPGTSLKCWRLTPSEAALRSRRALPVWFTSIFPCWYPIKLLVSK